MPVADPSLAHAGYVNAMSYACGEIHLVLSSLRRVTAAVRRPDMPLGTLDMHLHARVLSLMALDLMTNHLCK